MQAVSKTLLNHVRPTKVVPPPPPLPTEWVYTWLAEHKLEEYVCRCHLLKTWFGSRHSDEGTRVLLSPLPQHLLPQHSIHLHQTSQFETCSLNYLLTFSPFLAGGTTLLYQHRYAQGFILARLTTREDLASVPTLEASDFDGWVKPLGDQRRIEALIKGLVTVPSADANQD
jgi:hypothetical protein